MVHKDCFAYSDARAPHCTALKEMKCDGCAFHKLPEEINRPKKPKKEFSAADMFGRDRIPNKTKDEIANMRRSGIRVQAIADMTGVSSSQIYRILKDRLSESELLEAKAKEKARKESGE